jgi:hypothetical protein
MLQKPLQAILLFGGIKVHFIKIYKMFHHWYTLLKYIKVSSFIWFPDTIYSIKYFKIAESLMIWCCITYHLYCITKLLWFVAYWQLLRFNIKYYQLLLLSRTARQKSQRSINAIFVDTTPLEDANAHVTYILHFS